MLKMLQNYQNTRNTRLAFVGLALGIAVLEDVFLWGTKPGLNFLIFILLVHLLFITLIGFTKEKKQKLALVLLIPISVMSANVVLYNNLLVHHWAPFFTIVLSIIFFVLYTLENSNKHRFSFLSIPLFKSIDLPFQKWAHLYRDLFYWKESPKEDVVRKILIGVVIAMPLVAIFGFLFTQADSIFAEWVGNLLNIKPDLGLRLFVMFLITLFASSLFYVLLSDQHSLVPRESKTREIDAVIISVVLGAINLLFCIFIFFQLKYLFGGASFVLENGITYADYARNGFFQLCWVVGLAAIILLVVYRSFVFHKGSKLVTMLESVLILQVLVIAVSALKRMNLYQDEYGYTVLRLYVEWFIYFSMLVLSFAGVSLIIRFEFRKFFHSTLIAGVVATAVISSINVDYVIAKENVDRFVHSDKSIDIEYLNLLSIDVVPALQPLLEDPAIYNRLSIDDKLLLDNLITSKYTEIGQMVSWKEFNLGIMKGLERLLDTDQTVKQDLIKSRAIDSRYEALRTYILAHAVLAPCDFDTDIQDAIHWSCLEEIDISGSKTFKYLLATPYQDSGEAIEKSSIGYVVFRVYPLDVTGSLDSVIFEKQLVYNTNNEYTLLKGGKIVESVFDERTHYVYQVIHDGDSVSLSERKEVESLQQLMD